MAACQRLGSSLDIGFSAVFAQSSCSTWRAGRFGHYIVCPAASERLRRPIDASKTAKQKEKHKSVPDPLDAFITSPRPRLVRSFSKGNPSMDAVISRDFEDWPDWPLQTSRRVSYASATTQNSDSSLLSVRKFLSPPSPPTSPTVSDPSRSSRLLPDEVVRLKLNPSMTISFIRKSRLFRIQYGFIDIIKEANGTLKALELGGQQHTFVHTFVNSRLPVPHLENPRMTDDTPLRVSFLDEQTVQTSNTTFNTQLSYTFGHWDDCVRFQEILLASKLIFMAGIAEAKSKGRGEECISQNMRLLRGRHDRMVLLFFANSQRKDRKRYVSVPLNCIDKIDVPKKASRPISLHLLPNFELLAEMKVLQLQFLDDDERKKFGELMTQFLE